MTEETGGFVANLTWDEVERRLSNGAAAILPIGAGAKEHGFHLPMNTDQMQAEWLAKRIAERFGALIWPTLTYGYYPAFVEYAGSCGLTCSTFSAAVREIVVGLLRFGARPVLVLDTGISTLRPVSAAISEAASAHVRHLKPHDGRHYVAAADAFREQSHGSHADELETSRMLEIAPEVVEMSRAEASPESAAVAPGPLSPTDTRSANYSRSGSFGDPTLATARKGRSLLDAMLEDLFESVAQAMTASGRAIPDEKKPPRA